MYCVELTANHTNCLKCHTLCCIAQQSLVCTASFHTVVLYNCGGLSGDDCSVCLGLSADYSCGYCRPACTLNSLACVGGSIVQAPDYQQCGAFTVTEVSVLYTTLCCDYLLDNNLLFGITLSVDLPLCWSCCWRHSVHNQGHQPGCLSKGEHQHPHWWEGV